MSFKVFIYYCALCGGWAAFLAWTIGHLGGFVGRGARIESDMVKAMLTGGLLGLFVAAAVGTMDALLNAVGSQRIIRVLLCLVIGMVGGFLGGLIGQLFFEAAR